jgi:hypothetical protein
MYSAPVAAGFREWRPLVYEQSRRLDLLFDRKRLDTEAQALGSSPPSVVFQKLIQVNSHEQGLSASFVILCDYFLPSSTSQAQGASKMYKQMK